MACEYNCGQIIVRKLPAPSLSLPAISRDNIKGYKNLHDYIRLSDNISAIGFYTRCTWQNGILSFIANIFLASPHARGLKDAYVLFFPPSIHVIRPHEITSSFRKHNCRFYRSFCHREGGILWIHSSPSPVIPRCTCIRGVGKIPSRYTSRPLQLPSSLFFISAVIHSPRVSG